MYYKESKLILKNIKKAEKILVNCHAGADTDSVASAASLAHVITKFGKEITIGAPERVSSTFDFLLDEKNINVLDFNSEDINQYDLILIVDSEHWGRIFRAEKPINKKVINIDHHIHNSIDGEINLIDRLGSSTCEMLYLMYRDWNIKIDEKVSSKLLAGIYSDTGFFQYASTTSRCYKVAAELVELGADFNNIILNLKRKRNLNIIKLWGYMAINAEKDAKGNFAWSAIPYEVYKKYKTDGLSPTSEATDNFLRVIDGVDFAIGMVEKEPKKLHLSLRARVTGFDVSKIARELNGGGHKDASGGAVMGLSFEGAVKKVLRVARKYAKKE